jgi:aryl-alcohol dehydrogenase-like predicted oxidoreductase
LTNRGAWKSGLIDACKERGVIPLVRNPLDGGLASGRYTATNPSGGEAGGAASRYPFSKLEKLQPLHSVHETVAERASARVKREVRDVKDRYKSRYGPGPKINTDITTTQVAINYVIAKGAVPICDVRDSQQAEEILGCLGWGLTEDEVDMLDAAADLCGL